MAFPTLLQQETRKAPDADIAGAIISGISSRHKPAQLQSIV